MLATRLFMIDGTASIGAETRKLAAPPSSPPKIRVKFASVQSWGTQNVSPVVGVHSTFGLKAIVTIQ